MFKGAKEKPKRRCFTIHQILLIRHGQTDANLHHIVQGQSDTSLNETGRRQAKKVAMELKEYKANLIISSDLKRAKETAYIISKECKIPIIFDERLREMNLGMWEGKSFEEVMNQPSSEIWEKTPSKWKIEGSETLKEVQERMVSAIQEFSEKYGDIIVVSHGIAISTFVIYVKGISLDSMWDYLPDNTSVKKVRVDFLKEIT